MNFRIAFLLLLFTVRAEIFPFQPFFLKFTKVNCKSFFDGYTFEFCDVKAISRELNYIRFKFVFDDAPCRNLSADIQLMKRANGWKPFLYKKRFNVCQFLQKPNHPVVKIFINFGIGHSNMVKIRCPIPSPFIIDNLTNAHVANKLQSMQIPEGDYALFTTWYFYNVKKTEMKFYATVQEDH